MMTVLVRLSYCAAPHWCLARAMHTPYLQITCAIAHVSWHTLHSLNSFLWHLQVHDFKHGSVWPVLAVSYETIRKFSKDLAGFCDLLICDEGCGFLPFQLPCHVACITPCKQFLATHMTPTHMFLFTCADFWPNTGSKFGCRGQNICLQQHSQASFFVSPQRGATQPNLGGNSLWTAGTV
jgi:hypothetical protein